MSWPSDNKKTDVTLLTCFLSLIVFKANWSPLLILVPPLPERVLMYASKLTKFYGVTHLSPQTLSPKP